MGKKKREKAMQLAALKASRRYNQVELAFREFITGKPRQGWRVYRRCQLRTK